MASSQDYQTGIYSGGWWNPGRSLFPPCSAPLSDFMWLDSSVNNMDEQDEMKQATDAASYSRSDESSDDYHSSSAYKHLLVISSGDYGQTFQHGHNPQVVDFSISDWSSENSLLYDSPNMMNFRPTVNGQKNSKSGQDFYNQDMSQFDATVKESQTGLDNSASTCAHPAIIQTLADADLTYVFENSFEPNNWSKLLLYPSPEQQLNGGTKHTNANSYVPFWDSLMSNDHIDTLESHQILAVPALMEDQKPCTYENTAGGIILMSPKVGSKDKIANKVVSSIPTLLGAKRRNNTTSDELYKRQRFETPSSLPTFKVRKEKLGDRITALQQLVSPFGKTDTASVLHEAIEYIKFLHDQVSVLRTPYMQNGTSTSQGEPKKYAGSEGPKQDLKSRGLCLVHISSTFPVTNETTADFWTPTFGGTMTFR